MTTKTTAENTKHPAKPLDETADAEWWNADKYALAGARLTGDSINFVTPGEEFGYEHHRDFAQNGDRYELHKTTEPEHPDILSTVEDYESAPSGTIVSRSSFTPCVKYGRGVWLNWDGDEQSDQDLAGISRNVKRWGWFE